MDGTLTEPRQAFDKRFISILSKLASLTEIGIVSGSDYNYIREQMSPLFRSEVRYKLHILPCNGTKHYTPPKQNDKFHELVFEENMKDKISVNEFNELMKLLVERQYHFSHVLPYLSGHFIDYRGSMINWCPIGRNAEPSERKAFVDLDTSLSLRQKERETLLKTKKFLDLNLTVKIGGDTSFDIYPKGWDKTFCLTHFPEYESWFVGDKCNKGGNDLELYELLFTIGKSFKTTGPKETMDIIKNKIMPSLLKGKKNDFSAAML